MQRTGPSTSTSLATGATRSASTGRLRIMQVILSHGFAGSERAVAEACNGMCDRHDVTLVVRHDHRGPGGASIRDHVDPRVDVVEVPGRWRTRRRLAEAIQRIRPMLIHTHLRRGTRYVAQIRPNAAHVCTLHLSINGPHFLQSDGLFCISEWQLGTVPVDYRGRVFLVPNSLVPQPRIDADRVRQLKSSLGASDSEFVVGSVGRLARSKGFDVLLRAFERAALPHARLVIVGDGRERRKLEKLAGANVILTGFRSDAKDLYQVFDLFVSPSRSEPFGRVIVEALDAGTPVIATDVQGPRDIARRYPLELVPSEDVAAMAEALRRAEARPRARIGVDLSEFHIQAIAERLIDAYREVIAARTAAAGPPGRGEPASDLR
jgi:glycosyltransferase involved in cell wall biosynthesis